MYFTVEEENLICLYHNADRHRTAANFRAALPDMDKEMAALACQTVNKLDAMSDADFAAQRFHFTDEYAKRRARGLSKPLRPALLFCNKSQIKTSLPLHF